jgi:hypothetical protein
VPQPLDIALSLDVGDGLAELAETLHDVNDPVAILSMCEDRDEEQGLPPGTSLQQYYEANFKTKEKCR